MGVAFIRVFTLRPVQAPVSTISSMPARSRPGTSYAWCREAEQLLQRDLRRPIELTYVMVNHGRQKHPSLPGGPSSWRSSWSSSAYS